MNKIYLSLGSNEGNRIQWLQKAMDLIAARYGAVLTQSSVYETAAWGITAQPDFLNMVTYLETNQAPNELLETILGIETTLGRHRDVKWGPRIIDIDILFFNDEIIERPGLIIPHPYLHERRFTLTPLAEIAPDYVHPKLQKTITALLAECPDKLEVHKYKGLLPPQIALY